LAPVTKEFLALSSSLPSSKTMTILSLTANVLRFCTKFSTKSPRALMFIVYKTYKETSDMLQVFKDCEQWYIKFMRWEEDEIIKGKTI